MNYRNKMRKYLKEPSQYSNHYGKWGILNKEQRDLITRLLNEMDCADMVIKQQFEEIHNLQNRIDKAIELIKNKLSTETYQHLKALYDDIDKIEEVWEDYKFDDLLDILKESGE